jgi:GNAT superfamily N-acetyltransferase
MPGLSKCQLYQLKLGFEDLSANHRCVMIVVMVELGGMVLEQNSFLIRVARPDDEPFLNIWLYDSYSAGMVGFYDDGLLARALPLIIKANPELLSSGRFFVAESPSGALLGCGGWTREKPGSNTVTEMLAHIRHFATRPDYCGLGIGRAIFDRCMQQAVLAGVRRFECHSSLNAERFYKSVGFVSGQIIQVPLAEGVTFPVIVMQREL